MKLPLAFVSHAKYTKLVEPMKEKLARFSELEVHQFNSVEEMERSGVWRRLKIFVPFFLKSQELDTVLKNNPVEWVHSASAGIDAYLTPLMKASPAVLTNSKGAYNRSLVEYVIASMLYFNKRIPQLNLQKSAKNYSPFLMPTLYNKSVGILGYGSIGRDIAKSLKCSFSPRIIGIRKSGPLSDDFADSLIRIDSLISVLPELDFVVMVLPKHPDTDNIISHTQLHAMKPSSYLINIGRGSTLDENALISALNSDRIAGAALDVFKEEPLKQDSKLWDCKNLLISPHNADMTADLGEECYRVLESNLRKYLAGEELVTIVDKVKGY
jgi:D-2-hydroxyacid dehydrogenase (NADP+)